MMLHIWILRLITSLDRSATGIYSGTTPVLMPICRWYYTFKHYSDLSRAPLDINNQLAKISDWPAVNKLSINVKKTKFVVFHAINKDIEELVPELQINNIAIERVENFNFLGLIFNEHMFWKHPIDIIANKLIRFPGILDKLKRF